MARQTKSQKIRVLLTQGKTVKEIAKAVKCPPGLVYQVRSYDKRKAEKAIVVPKGVLASVPKKPTVKDLQKAVVKAKTQKVIQEVAMRKMRDYENAWDMAALSASKVPLAQPKDYMMPKRNIVQRFFNWLCGG